MRIRLLVLACILLVSGCTKKEKPVVGVVPKGANHIFWQTVHAGAVKAAKEYGVRVEWNAPALEIDAPRQISIVESMVNRRLAGIAVAPVDRKALISVVERASNSGIPVAIFDSDLDSNQRITYVATDNREGGRMGARKLAQLINEKGKVAYIGFMPGSAATMERQEGFFEEIKKFPNIRVVQTEYGMADRSKAMAATENILTAHKDLVGVFADNESSSAGAALALRSRAAWNTRMVAFDASEQLINDLHDKFIDALIVQNPFKMGYEAVRAIGMKLNGETPPTHTDSGLTLVTRADVEKPDVIPLLYPDIRTYLDNAEQ